MATRPHLDERLSEDEFERWYWTMAELQPFARSLGVRAAGPKRELMRRIGARLAGRPEPADVARRPTSVATAPIGARLTRSTVVPEGQRATQALRAFFRTEIGPAFRFNGHMRAFLLEGGATLGDAVEHWYRTVGTPLPTQSDSLEFNRFTREWHVANPEGTAAACRAAWFEYRSLPADQRVPPH